MELELECRVWSGWKRVQKKPGWHRSGKCEIESGAYKIICNLVGEKGSHPAFVPVSPVEAASTILKKRKKIYRHSGILKWKE
jgi:ribonuclease PH